MTESGHGLAGHPTVVAVRVSGRGKPPVVRPGRGPSGPVWIPAVPLTVSVAWDRWPDCVSIW